MVLQIPNKGCVIKATKAYHLDQMTRSNKKKNKWLITRLEPWSKYVFMAAEKGLLTNYKKSVLGLLGLVSRPSVPGWNFDLLTTVWKLRKFTFTLFWQKFRESNVFAKEITKEMIWRNIFLVRVNSSFFHTVLPPLQKIFV